MKVKFEMSEKVKEKVAQVFKRYFDEFPDLEIYGTTNTKIVHSTGNTWKITNDSLCYEGSREGFLSFTPFSISRGVSVKPCVPSEQALFEGAKLGLRLYSRDDREEYTLPLVSYSSSHPDLQDDRYFSCRLAPLEENPDKAVVEDFSGVLIKVVKYDGGAYYRGDKG